MSDGGLYSPGIARGLIMSTALAIGCALALLVFALNVLRLVRPKWRASARLWLKVSGLATIAGFTGLVLAINQEDHQKAVALGFTSATEMRAASDAGFSDANLWQVEKDRVALEKTRAEEAAKAQKLAEERAAEQKAKEEAETCRKTLKCIGEKHAIEASVQCAPSIEKLAKYDHQWTDGWLESKFSHYRWKDKERNIITYIGDKIKFQNGFGAWQHHTYQCDFDLRLERATEVRAQPGRL